MKVLTEKSVEYLPREQQATEALLQRTRSRKEQMNPDPTKNDPAVSRQDSTLHGFATQWKVPC